MVVSASLLLTWLGCTAAPEPAPEQSILVVDPESMPTTPAKTTPSTSTSTTKTDTGTPPKEEPFDCDTLAGKASADLDVLPPPLQDLVDGTVTLQPALTGVNITSASCLVTSDFLPNTDSYATRVFSHYEPLKNTPTNVLIEPSEPTVVVLMSYEATDWEITEVTPGSVVQVFYGTYEPGTTVAAPAGVPVSDLGDYLDWKYRTVRTMELHRELDARGYPIDSYSSCYRTDTFDVAAVAAPNVTESIPSCKPGALPTAPDSAWAAGVCPAATGGPGICLSAGYSESGMLNPSTGAGCSVGPGPNDGFRPASRGAIGWSGTHMYACSEDNMLVRIDLVTNDIEWSYLQCDGVAVTECGLFVRRYEANTTSGELVHFDTFEEAMCGVGATVHGDLPQPAFGVHDDLVVVADWHSTDTVDWTALGKTPAPASLVLSRDGWIDGLFLHSSQSELFLLSGGEIHGAQASGATTPMSRTSLSVPAGLACDGP